MLTLWGRYYGILILCIGHKSDLPKVTQSVSSETQKGLWPVCQASDSTLWRMCAAFYNYLFTQGWSFWTPDPCWVLGRHSTFHSLTLTPIPHSPLCCPSVSSAFCLTYIIVLEFIIICSKNKLCILIQNLKPICEELVIH